MANQLAVSAKLVNAVKPRQTKKEKKSSNDDSAAFGQALAEAHAANKNNVQAEDKQPEAEQPEQPEQVQEAGAAQTAAESAVQSRIVRTVPGAAGVEEAKGAAENLLGVTAGFAAGAAVEEAAKGAAAGEAVLPGTDMTNSMATEAQQVLKVSDQSMAEPLQEGAQQRQTGLQAEKLPEGGTPQTSLEEAPAQPEVQFREISKETGVRMGRQESGQTQEMKGQKGKKTEAADQETEISYEAAGSAVSKEAQTEGLSNGQEVSEKEHVTANGEISPEYAELLKGQIVRQIVNGKEELELHLSPKYLGSLTIRVAHEAGRTAVSIICSDDRAMRAMSQKAAELGQILEDRMGTRTEVYVDDHQEQSRMYQDGRGGSNGEREQRQSQNRQRHEEADTADFLQQLRLGLV